jgi:hypothetical protein
VSAKNPFPGLRPFGKGEEHLFFGREAEVDSMIDVLAAQRFLAVVGASGSGKSSLVEVGLRPALHQGLMTSAGPLWQEIKFSPGGTPIRELARALTRGGRLFPHLEGKGYSAEAAMEANLRLSKRGLMEALSQADLAPGQNVLIFVDQFEELFRYASGESGTDSHASRQDAAAFVNLLLEIPRHSGHRVYVVLTMRSDFLGDCARFQGLPEAVNRGQYLVPRMTREERRAAIVGPARIGGAEVSPVLLTRLLNDVGDDPDQLSILQHALNRTWVRWEAEGAEGPLTLKQYTNAGTMAEALDQHAEEAYAALGSPELEALCQRIFRALTDKATDPRGVRRPTRFAELCEIVGATPAGVRKVLDTFRTADRPFLLPALTAEPADPGGLVDDSVLDDDAVVDISHESLLRVWKQLQRWSDEEAKSAHLYRDLAHAAAERRSYWRDPELQMALDWWERQEPTRAWAQRYGSGFEAASGFLEASEADRRRGRRNRWLMVAAIVALIGLVGGQQYLAVVERARDEVERAEERANMQEDINRDLNEHIQVLTESIPFLADTVQDLVLVNETLQFDILKRSEHNRDLTREITDLQIDIDSLSANAERQERDTADVVERMAALRREKEGWEQRLPGLIAARDSLQGSFDGILAVNDSLRRELLLVREGVLIVALDPIEHIRTVLLPGLADTLAQGWPEGDSAAYHLDLSELPSRPDLLTELAGLLVQTQTLEAVVEMLSSQNQELSVELAGLEDERSLLEAAKDGHTNDRAAVLSRLDALADRLRDLRAERSLLEDEVAALERQVASTEAAIDVLNAGIADLMSEQRVLTDALAQDEVGR